MKARNEIAILLAAGLGLRMRPLTNKIPKPLVKVYGIPLIETTINALEKRGISHIYIVVGYLKEQFEYLTRKYNNISLVFNDEYLTVNNISSLHCIERFIGDEDCFVCESDCFVSDENYFVGDFKTSCYFGKRFEGYSDDWVLEHDSDGRITRIGKYGLDSFNCCGVAFLRNEDAKLILNKIDEAYLKPGSFESKFWDEIVNENLDSILLTIHPIKKDQTIEIDTLDELSKIDSNYESNN